MGGPPSNATTPRAASPSPGTRAMAGLTIPATGSRRHAARHQRPRSPAALPRRHTDRPVARHTGYPYPDPQGRIVAGIHYLNGHPAPSTSMSTGEHQAALAVLPEPAEGGAWIDESLRVDHRPGSLHRAPWQPRLFPTSRGRSAPATPALNSSPNSCVAPAHRSACTTTTASSPTPGRLVTVDDADPAEYADAPLDDFGEPHAGCTHIRYLSVPLCPFPGARSGRSIAVGSGPTVAMSTAAA